MTAADLPYEIWLHVFRFLDKKTIRQLRFVNTVFHNLSLDEHHRITQIGYASIPGDYSSLRDRGNSRRVRVLLLRSGPIYPQKDEFPRAPESRPSFWKSIRKFSRMLRDKPKTDLDSLLDAVPGLTKLTSLDIDLLHNSKDPFHAMKIKILEVGWPIFADNVTTLSLNVPLEEIHLVVPSYNTLLRLESFAIVLYNFHSTSEPNELIRRTLLPFLINLGPTLRSLKLSARGPANVDISSILADLPHMPYLRNLDISHPFLSLELTSLIGHHLFLEAHQSQLQYLSFDFVAQSSPFNITDEFFKQEWCRVLLPVLQFLSFRLSGFTVSFEAAAITYFQRQIPTLESLVVHPLCFSYDQIASIITGLQAGGYQLRALGTLDVQIQCFSPDFLTLLADRIPHLRSLKLVVMTIRPDKQPKGHGSSMIPEFCKALKSSRFPDWGLHDMDIANRHGFSVRASLRNQCKVALFHTLPNLQLFCGLGPSESWPQEQLYHRFDDDDDMPNAFLAWRMGRR